MIKHTVWALALGMLLFFLYVAMYTGAFKPVSVGLDDRGPYSLIFKNHNGPYNEIIKPLETVEAWAKNNKIDCRFTFAEFFDNPTLVEEGRLRSRTGCLLELKNESEIEKIKKVILPEEFKIEEFKKTKSVVAIFSGSPGIGPYKVYPQAEDFIQKNNLKTKGSVIEIYEIFGPKEMTTTFLWPVL